MAAALALAGVVWVRASSGPPIAAGTVVRVVDGDTVIVRGPGGSTEDVRLIGIDTPETVDPRRPVGCFGPEASAYAKHLLTGRRVLLRYDRELHDRYGRFLAYIWLVGRGGGFVNARLVELGYARAYPFPPNTAHEALFAALERRAAIGGRGLWGAFGAAAAAAAAAYLSERGEPIAAAGNGHSGDESRRSMLRERIASARDRLRDELDSVRGE
jgi:endonuclease YncB( thermonuclease family)